MNVLVIAAHPDDEILGCGGTMARLVREGNDVHIAILGEGSTARSQSREDADMSVVETLKDCSQQAAEIIGAKDLFTFGLPDNRFDTLPLLDIVKIIEGLVERVMPDVIYTHHVSDLNVDHALLGRATMTATRPMAGSRVGEVYAFEIASSTEWGFQRIEPVFRADTFWDIASYLDCKIKALSVYKDEMRPFPHPRSPDAIAAIAQRWGSVVGCDAAEAFEAIRVIR